MLLPAAELRLFDVNAKQPSCVPLQKQQIAEDAVANAQRKDAVSDILMDAVAAAILSVTKVNTSLIHC
jgi:hypothetical protein